MAFPLAAEAATITDPVMGYAFDLPDGWKRVPQAMIQAWQSPTGATRASSLFNFVAAYEAPGPEGGIAFPCLLVEETPYAAGDHLDSMTETGVQKMTAVITGAHVDDLRKSEPGDFSGVNLAFLTQGGILYIAQPPGYCRGLGGLTKSGNLRGIVQGAFAKDHLITFNLYAKQADWEQTWPTLKTMAASFHLMPNQLVPVQSDTSPLDYAIYGVAAVGIVAVLWLMRRNPTRRS